MLAINSVKAQPYPAQYSGFKITSITLQAKRKQLWPSLVEKALAKMFNSYHELDGGSPNVGMSIMTGHAVQHVCLGLLYAINNCF